ncbi:hypothetical protein QBC39DRAFT_356408 [Podospora conica]|nr:hypothetical protein QBC39DRAFT_356408 [Schizothecium conicum]
MPFVAEISYSEQEFITAIRDYYRFITALYLDQELVVEPPEGGWPNVTVETFAPMEKSDAVVSLLQQIPYIRVPYPSSDRFMAAPWCWMADWDSFCRQLREGRDDAEGLKAVTQNLNDIGIEWDLQDEAVPAHVIGLTAGGRNNSTMLLDTKVGAVYWVGCPGRIAYIGHCSDDPDMINDDIFDYSEDPDNDWRGAPPWPVATFFEMLKHQFTTLQFIPLSSAKVVDVSGLETFDNSEGLVEMVQSIYREHGWPDLDRYRKAECIAAVTRAMEERYPLPS